MPQAQLEARVAQVAAKLLTNNWVTLKTANSFDSEGRKAGMRLFLDQRSYKPGLGVYDKSESNR